MSQKVIYLLIFLSLVSVFCQYLYKEYLPSDIPNPMTHPSECGRKGVKSSQICDPGEILNKDSKDVIEGYINEEDKMEMAVVIISKMKESFVGVGTIESASQNFARTLHDQWGVGNSKTNNGILLFLSISDRAVYISTGDGVKDKLNPRVITSVIDHMKNDLRKKDYGRAIELAVTEIKYIINPAKYKSSSFKYSNNIEDSSSWVIFAVIVVIIIVVIVFSPESERKKLAKGEAALKKYAAEVKNMETDSKYKSTSCPICLEDFPKTSKPESTVGEESSSKDNNLRRPMVLRCNHIFCYQCLREHLKQPQGKSCPICRQPVDQDENHQPPPPQPNRRSPGGGGGCSDQFANASAPPENPNYIDPGTDRYHWDRHRPEMLFRLSRLRHFYPSVMTDSYYNRMSYAINNNTVDSVTEIVRLAEERRIEVEKAISDIDKREAARKKGSSGSRSSGFGGGRSSGGGGGRW
jgi:uncharacterized membrane protein YgcG